MTLLAPAALWTLAALALPLAIHLWRRPPRTVRLGSLRFLQSGPRRLRDLRWRELALLAVRLGLLTLLTLGLARPFLQPRRTHLPGRWVLLDPAAAPAGPSLDRLRALRAAGAETRLLAPGFPSVSTPPADGSAPAPDAWSLLREADATLPAGSTLAVFSPGRLASLRGVRPSLTHARVEWVQTPSAAPPPVPVATPVPPARPLTVRVLHAADRAEDARYVAAALRAVAVADGRPLEVSDDLTDAPFRSTDWAFWLAARSVPPGLTASAAHVFNDAADPAPDASPGGWIVPAPGTAGFGAPVRLWRRVPPADGSVFWTDGFGRALLTRTEGPHGSNWHFASRFSPAWNDLPLGTALPAALRALLADPAAEPPGEADRRLADPAQFPPSEPGTAAASLALPSPGVDLQAPVWLLAALLFGLERLLSHRRAPTPITPAPASAPEPALAR